MFNILRKLYLWMLDWSTHPYGTIILFVLSFAEASFFPIPPDVLLIAMCLGLRNHSLKFAIICTLGSVLGAIFGYLIGYYLWWNGNEYSIIADSFFKYIPGFNEELFINMQSIYNDFGFLIIFTAGFTPIPFKIFTISSGAFLVPIYLFVLASTISRAFRFFILSIIIWKYGNSIKIYIDRYFNILTIIFVLLLFCGLFLFKILL